MLARRCASALALALALLALAACGSSGDGAATAGTGAGDPTTTVPGGAVDPNAPEVVEPGDIPDNQVFVTYSPTSAPFAVDVPEGWARTEQGGVTTFTDHYNSITIRSMASAPAPTVEGMRGPGLADVAPDPTFQLQDVTTVTRPAGDGVLATYEIGSPADPVTGKQALLAVERYAFDHDGTTVVLTLSGAKGADNVDPWRTVTTSLMWV